MTLSQLENNTSKIFCSTPRCSSTTAYDYFKSSNSKSSSSDAGIEDDLSNSSSSGDTIISMSNENKLGKWLSSSPILDEKYEKVNSTAV